VTSTSISALAPRRASWPARAAEGIGKAFETLARWRTTRFEREHLASLDDRMLHDIGLTRADVEREYNKPFWRN
jgi:uncharacterized protein YjiS (DUF1127 family)